MTQWLADYKMEAIEGVVLFGSKSRGDSDSGSDTDLAVFAKADTPERLVVVKKKLAESVCDENVNLSVYSTSTAEQMADNGSLFLWHLKLEGRILYQRDNWADRLLNHLAPYTFERATEGLTTLQSVLDDVTISVIRSDSTVLFEAATLFSVLRTLGMITTTAIGKPCFGRLQPIYMTRELMDGSSGITNNEIETLLQARLTYSGKRSESPNVDSEWCMKVARKIRQVLNFVQELLAE